MTKDDVFDVFKKVAKEKCEQDTPDSARHASFQELGYDSLEVADLIMGIENSIGVSLASEKYEAIRTIDDLCSVFATTQSG